MEASRFRDDLWKGIRDLNKKSDLIVLVHNLSHRIPRYSHGDDRSQQQPALSLLLDEAKSLGIPWVLAITNKFSVSAHQQKAAIDTVIKAYQASPSTTSVINSCPYFLPGAPVSWESGGTDSDRKMGPERFIFAPINLALRPFQKRAAIFAVEGVTDFCQLIHATLCQHEEAAFEELARDRLFVELARGRAIVAHANEDAKENALSAAAVGASLGAGLGIVLAVVMGAASALRKP